MRRVLGVLCVSRKSDFFCGQALTHFFTFMHLWNYFRRYNRSDDGEYRRYQSPQAPNVCIKKYIIIWLGGKISTLVKVDMSAMTIKEGS